MRRIAVAAPSEQAFSSFAPDQAVAEWFRSLALANPALTDTGEVLAYAMHPWVFRTLVGVGAVVAWRAGRRRAALVAGVTMAAGSLLGLGIKVAVARPRPVWGDPVATEIGYSMPSGHALNAALGSCLLLALGWSWLRHRGQTRAAISGGALVVAVAMLDRLLLGVHYLTDVLVGATLGTLLGMAAARFLGVERCHASRAPRRG